MGYPDKSNVPKDFIKETEALAEKAKLTFKSLYVTNTF